MPEKLAVHAASGRTTQKLLFDARYWLPNMKNLLMRLLALLTNHPVLGHVEAFHNRQRRWNENDHYLRIPIVCTGHREYLLLTPQEYSYGRMRACRNPEDCPEPSGLIARYLFPILRRLSYQRINRQIVHACRDFTDVEHRVVHDCALNVTKTPLNL